MCVAVPGRLIQCQSAAGVVDLAGSQVQVSCALVPDAAVGDWVLVHAGFVIQRLSDDEAREVFGTLAELAAAGEQPAAAPGGA